MSTAKVEFTVEIPRGENARLEPQVRDSLKGVEANLLEIDSTSGRVVLETAHPWSDLLTRIENTGLRAALTGFGGRAAVSIVHDHSSDESVKGVIRFSSPTAETKELVVDGVIDGLQPDKLFHIQIHECGDLSKGCESVGDMYGARRLGMKQANDQGRMSFRFTDNQFSISDLVGRSVVVAEAVDTSEKRIACGIIARAAGINENFKRICACDGITLWDERNVPSAGGARKDYAKE